MKRLAPFAASLTSLASLALMPAVADAMEAPARSDLSLSAIFAKLTPVQGAVVTGLLVFAAGVVVAVIVNQIRDRLAPAVSKAPTTKASPDTLLQPRAVPPLYSFAPAALPSRQPLTDAPWKSPTGDMAVPEAPGRFSRGDRQPLALPAALPAIPEAPPSEGADATRPLRIPGSSANLRSLNPQAAAILAAGDLVTEGGDADATTEFVRGRNLRAAEAPRRMMRTLRFPPKSPTSSGVLQKTDVSELDFEDLATEVDIPRFEMETPGSSTTRLSRAKTTSPDETQAFLLTKCS